MPTSDESNSRASGFLLAPNTILQSRYRIVRRLGKGGMGAVYEAVDLRLGATVAVKQTLTTDEHSWKQFEREARLLAQLNHPALPRVSDYFTEGNRAFFVMQFIEGADLAQIITQQPGPFPRNQVVAWADQLLDALVYVHSRDRQIIHRDIKPHNLKLMSTGQIALLDFGLAKTRGPDSAGATSCTSVFGYTPRYAPLEQIQDLGTTPQSDIYALGATLYHLLTGVKPSDALTRAAALVNSKPNPLRPANEINSSVGPELAAIISRAMAQNPEERYASAAEFREALRRLGRDDAVTTSHEGDAEDSLVLTETAETTVVTPDDVGPAGRLGSRAIAAVLVILVTALGVFCHYYSWKLPPTLVHEAANPAASIVEPVDESARANSGRTGRSRQHRNAVINADQRVIPPRRRNRTSDVYDGSSRIDNRRLSADRFRQEP